MADWFDDLPVIGAMPDDLAAAKLIEMGDLPTELVAPEESRHETFALWGRRPAYRHTAHAFGHIGDVTGGDPIRVIPVAEIEPDLTLQSHPLRISLGKMAVVDYPGGGTHVVLFDFAARHYVSARRAEQLHYNVVVRVMEGQRAGLLNVPIFVGLNPGKEGVAFRGYTVNVKNEQDEALLSMLDSGVIRNGLHLLQAAQPALAPLSQIAYSLTKSFAGHSRNVPVQSFELGLDFTQAPYGAVLRTGAYVAVQLPPELEYSWDWGSWVYEPRLGDIVDSTGGTNGLPYNHVVFTVSRLGD